MACLRRDTGAIREYAMRERQGPCLRVALIVVDPAQHIVDGGCGHGDANGMLVQRKD